MTDEPVLSKRHKAICTVVAIAYSFIVPVAVSATVGAAEGAIALASGALVMILANLDQLASFSVAGIKGEMRHAVARVDVTRVHLQNMAVMLANPILGALAGGGRIAGLGPELFQTKDRVMGALREMGISDSKLSEAEDSWKRQIIFDHASVLIDGAVSVARSDQKDVIKRELEKLRSFNKGFFVAGSQDFKEILKSHMLLTSEVQDYLDDLDHFQRTTNFRRRDVFMRNRGYDSL